MEVLPKGLVKYHQQTNSGNYMITLTQRDECCNDMITGRVAVVEGLVAKPMRERVHAESGLLHEEDAEDPGVDEASEVVTPRETCY